MMWLQDHKARLVNLTLEQPLSSKHKITTNFNTAYVPLQVIFMYIDKVSILTLISRRTDQEIHNKLELKNYTKNSTQIA
jgi:hypothetical protein